MTYLELWTQRLFQAERSTAMRVRATGAMVAWAVVASLAACSNDPEPVEEPSGPLPAELLELELAGLTLDEFYEVSFRALSVRDPEQVIADALSERFQLTEVSLTDLSADYQRDTADMVAVVHEALQTYDREALTAEQQISYDVYAWHLQDRLDTAAYPYFGYPATYSIFGVHNGTRLFFTDLHPMATAQDARDYVARLPLVRDKFNQLIEHLRAQEESGIIEPAITTNAAYQSVLGLLALSAEDNPFYAAFRDKLEAIAELSSEERNRLLADALDATEDHVIPAYIRLGNALSDLLSRAPTQIGVGQFEGGDAYYTHLLRHYTTTSMTPTEIHELGVRELERIHAEMRALFDQLGYPENETLEQLYQRVVSDGGVVPGDQAVAAYEDIIQFASENLDQAFDLFPMAEVVVIGGASGGYYIAASFDGSRPGAFYAGVQGELARYDMPTLAYHEAIPGHHMQIALAQEMDLPFFRKNTNFTAYVEGWALYAERLAWEFGWYDDDPYGNLGRLQFEAMRAARLVVDTGIHDLGWSFDHATTVFGEATGYTLGPSQGNVARYSVIPGQATAYMIGMLSILELRQRAMDALGDAFDLIAFHRAVLGNGAMPLDVLEQVVDDFISDALTTK